MQEVFIMSSKKPDKRIERSRSSFESALVRLLEKYPLEKISVSMIVDASGYSRSAFYANYENRDDCLKSLLDRMASIVVDRSFDSPVYTQSNSVGTDPFKNPDTYFKHYLLLFESIYEHKGVFKCLINHIYEKWTEYFKWKVVSLSLDSFVLQLDGTDYDEKDLNMEMYYYIGISELLILIEYWFRNDLVFSPEYMAKHQYLKKVLLPFHIVPLKRK